VNRIQGVMVNNGIRCSEMAPGIVRIVLSHPYPPSNVYFLRGNPPALVDSGHPGDQSFRVMIQALHSLGYAPEELGTIVYTHPHRDHLGGGVRLQVPGWIHHREVEGLADLYESSRREIDLRLERARYIFGHNGDHFFSSSDLDRFIHSQFVMRGCIPVEGSLREGDGIQLGERTWTVLEAPGHHVHHICLYDPSDGILLAGDAVIRNVVTVGNDLHQYIATLKRLAQLNCRLMLPGHGAPIDRPSKMIAVLIDLACRRKELILELISREPMGVPQIMSGLFARLPKHYAAYQSIAGQILQFLKALKAEDRIEECIENGRITFIYSPNPDSRK